MSPIFTAKLILAGLNALFGLVALIRPDLVARVFGLSADRPQALAEIRVQYGGMYLAMGVAAIVLRFSPTAFLMFGIAYAGMALTRMALMARDRSLRTRSNALLLAFQLVSALVFIAESSWWII